MNYLFKPRFSMIDNVAMVAGSILIIQGRYIAAALVLITGVLISVVTGSKYK